MDKNKDGKENDNDDQDGSKNKDNNDHITYTNRLAKEVAAKFSGGSKTFLWESFGVECGVCFNAVPSVNCFSAVPYAFDSEATLMSTSYHLTEDYSIYKDHCVLGMHPIVMILSIQVKEQ